MRQILQGILGLVLIAGVATGAVAEDTIRVPAVKGLQVDKAIKVLEDQGLNIRVIEVAGPAVDVVDSQDPPAGLGMRRGGTVTIRIGIASRIETRLPDVGGKPIETALRTLAPAYDVMIVPVPAGTRRPGTVIRTEPRAGSKVWFRAPVTIYLAEREDTTAPRAPDGPAIPPVPAMPEAVAPPAPVAPLPPVFPPPPGRGAPANLAPPGAPAAPTVRPPTSALGSGRVPNLLGLDANTALQQITDAGLTPEPWYFRMASAPWQIYSQKIRAGTPLPPGSSVAYRVSVPTTLPAQVPAPWIQARTLADAIRTLSTLGFKVRIRGGTDINVPHQRVVTQTPSPGMLAARGSTVVLDLRAALPAPGTQPPLGPPAGAGTPPTADLLPPPDITLPGKPVPSVIGMRAAEAQRALAAAGLRGVVITTEAPEAAPGRVFEQEPPAGLPAEGGTVRIVVPDTATAGAPDAIYAKVPDVVNRSPANAEAAVNATGLRAVIERGPEAPGIPSIVIAQSHHPGALIRQGTLITVMIGAPPGTAGAVAPPTGDKKDDPNAVEKVGRFFRKTHKKAWGKFKRLFK